MKDQLFLRVLTKQKYLEEENSKMIALQISPKIESFYGLGGQATKLLAGFVWNFATFVRLPFGQFSFVELLTWLGSFFCSIV